jgi:hypothetical protein
MGFQLTNFNVVSAVMLGASVWMVWGRFTLRLESNWPLVYYLLMVIYNNTYPSRLNPYVLFISVVCGLLLRFEFMGIKVVRTVQIVEFAMLATLMYRLFLLIFVI